MKKRQTLLSPGAEAFIPPIPGVHSKNIFSKKYVLIWTKLKEKLMLAKRAVVIGAGFIGPK